MRQTRLIPSRSLVVQAQYCKHAPAIALAIALVLASACCSNRREPVSRPAPSELPFIVVVQFSPVRSVLVYASSDTGAMMFDEVESVGGYLVATLGDTLVIESHLIRNRQGRHSTIGVVAVVPDAESGVRVTRANPLLSFQQRQRLSQAIHFLGAVVLLCAMAPTKDW